jgi:hypothetical protein
MFIPSIGLRRGKFLRPGMQRSFTSSMTVRRQSSFFSEKALLRMEIQLRNTTPIHPVRPAKNMTSRMSLLQSISLNVIRCEPSKRPELNSDGQLSNQESP